RPRAVRVLTCLRGSGLNDHEGSYSSTPVPVVAGGVEHRKNDNRIFSNDEEDTIRKASGENPTDLRVRTQPHVAARIFDRAPDGRAKLNGELQTQTRV